MLYVVYEYIFEKLGAYRLYLVLTVCGEARVERSSGNAETWGVNLTAEAS